MARALDSVLWRHRARAHQSTAPVRRDPCRPDGGPVDGCPWCTGLLAPRARAGPFSAAASSKEEQEVACSDLYGDDDADGALSVEVEPGCEQRVRVETRDAAWDGGSDSDL